jgi:RNAse (barnase) inhibitor barstar
LIVIFFAFSFKDLEIMILRQVRPNIVQSIRAFRVDELQKAATELEQHFLYANLSGCNTKQEVLEAIAEQFTFPKHFGKNFDALADCLTDMVSKSGAQPGFIVVLEQIPMGGKFDREARETLLDVFRDTADFWAEKGVQFRCFYSFSVAPAGIADDAAAAATDAIDGALALKPTPAPWFGANFPLAA